MRKVVYQIINMGRQTKTFKAKTIRLACKWLMLNRDTIGFVIQLSLVRSPGEALFLRDN